MNGRNGFSRETSLLAERLQADVGPAPQRARDPHAELKTKIHRTCIARLGSAFLNLEGSDELARRVRAIVNEELNSEEAPLSPGDRADLERQIGDDILGYGPLEPYLQDPTVTEVMINGPNQIYIEKKGILYKTDARFQDREALVVALGVSAALAQSYPSKPVRLVLPYSPGGIIDYVGRTLATHLSGPLGQTVVAENRPGAGGIAGTDTVARSAPDGYTIVIMDPAIVINPTLQPSMPYDLFKQLQTVSIVSSSPEVVVVAPQLPVSPDGHLLVNVFASRTDAAVDGRWTAIDEIAEIGKGLVDFTFVGCLSESMNGELPEAVRVEGGNVTDGVTNVTIPRGEQIDAIDFERAVQMLADKRAKGPAKKPAAKKPAAKRAPAKKR